jgi:hypothetical protein
MSKANSGVRNRIITQFVYLLTCFITNLNLLYIDDKIIGNALISWLYRMLIFIKRCLITENVNKEAWPAMFDDYKEFNENLSICVYNINASNWIRFTQARELCQMSSEGEKTLF